MKGKKCETGENRKTEKPKKRKNEKTRSIQKNPALMGRGQSRPVSRWGVFSAANWRCIGFASFKQKIQA
jgi:hypothetical protein